MTYIKLNISRFGASLKVTASQTDKSVENNTSYINLTIELTTTGETYNNTGSAYVNATLTGANNTVKIPKTTFKISKGTTKTIYSGKVGPFNHNADGTLAAVSISVTAQVTDSTKATKSASCTMSTIARATAIGNQSGFIGQAMTITISPASTAFTHTLTYKLSDGTTGTIGSARTTSKTFSFTPPDSWYQKIPNATSLSGTLTLTTYSGSTTVGTKTSTLTVSSLTDASKPAVTAFAFEDTNDATYTLTKDRKAIVVGESNLKVTLTAVVNKYATLKKLTINGTDVTITNSSSSNGTTTIIGTFISEATDINSHTAITATITDSRGREFSFQPNENAGYFNNYLKPTGATQWSRPTGTASSINLDSLSGKVYTGYFGTSSTGTANTFSMRYNYKEGNNDYDNAKWVSIPSSAITFTENAFTVNTSGIKIDGLDYTKKCVIKIELTDKLNTVVVESTIASGQPLWYWTKSKFKVLTKFVYKDRELVDLIYPVGSIFMSTVGTDPGTYLGGTWERIQGKFLLAANDTSSAYNAGKTGGAVSATITTANLPAHKHTASFKGITHNAQVRCCGSAATGQVIAAYGSNTITLKANTGDSWGSTISYTTKSHKTDVISWTDGGTVTVNNTGSGTALSIMPPFVAVYVWKRTS